MSQEILSKINGAPSKTIRDIPVEISRIYTPNDSCPWYYSHHPYIVKFKGKFYGFWSNGRKNEDDCGQRIMMASSENFRDWKVSVLQESFPGKDSEMVLTCAGYHVHDGVLTVYVSETENGLSVMNDDRTGYVEEKVAAIMGRDPQYCEMSYIQTADGVTWSELTRFDLPGLIPNLGPVTLKDGRLFFCATYLYAISDDPAGVSGWTSKIIPHSHAQKANNLTEASVYEGTDGNLYILLRTDGGNRFAAVSTDRGESFSELCETQFQDTSSKFQIGRLPDGRYFFIGNVDSRRSSLVLMLSENGVDFDQHYVLNDAPQTMMKRGAFKGGPYGYPTVCLDEGYMYIIYSIMKESVEAVRVSLSDL